MAWLKRALLKGVLRDKVSGVLNVLPFNGKKTAIGLALLAISVALSFYNQPGTVLDVLLALKALLEQLGGTPLLDVGAVIAILGGLHKLLKQWQEDDSTGDKPPS